MASDKKYTFAFTGASALITETLIVAEEYEKLRKWDLVYKSLLDSNLLNKVKEATFKREFREIRKRLSLLTSDQLHILVHGSLEDSRAVILLSLVKTYSYLKDFILEILRNKYLLFERVLTETDYFRFFNSKSIAHSEMEALTDKTARKVKQRVFTILEQVGLITHSANGMILKPVLSSNVVNAVVEDNPSLLAIFLYSNEEIKLITHN